MKKMTMLLLVVLALLAVGASADEMDDLKAKVEAQDEEISQLKDQMDQLDSRQRSKEESMNEKIEEVDKKAESGGLPESMKWVEKISWYGDFRYRHEEINDQGRSSDSRYSRDRIRARIGMRAEISDEILFNIRLGTGSSDPKSANQTLGDSWSSKPVWVDRAYIAYRPKALPGFGIGIGKDETPYYKVGKNQMLWDDDLNMEGVYAEYTGDITSSTQITGSAGGFWVVERHGSSSVDTGMLGLQGLIEQTITESSKVVGGGSYYGFTNLKGQQALSNGWNTGSNNFYGNDNSGGGTPVYLMDYKLLELFLSWESAFGSLPYSVFGSWVQNMDAIANSVTGDKEDTGYIAGVTLNKPQKQWDWQLAYDYRQVKADAVVGQFTDSDFFGGNTGGKGHRVSGGLQLQKNTQLVATFFIDNEYDASHGADTGKKYNRIQLDLKVKFK
ncbi:putative porin [Planctomycetota bacterium]